MVARMPLACPALAGAGFVTLLLLVAADWAPLDRLDAAVSAAARAHGQENPEWVRLQLAITDAGRTVVFLALGLVGAVALLARRAYAAGALVALVLVAVPVLWGAMHTLLHRPRPVDGFVMITSNGFPSGHTTHAAAAALVAALLIWPRVGRRGRILLVTVAAGFAVLVGASRVALLAHWPSDVLGGWLLALAVVSAARCLVGRRYTVRTTLPRE